jgi:hypothetical protein
MNNGNNKDYENMNNLPKNKDLRNYLYQEAMLYSDKKRKIDKLYNRVNNGYIGIYMEEYPYILTQGIMNIKEFFDYIIMSIIENFEQKNIKIPLPFIHNINIFFYYFVQYFEKVYKITHKYIEKEFIKRYGVGVMNMNYYKTHRIGETRLGKKYKIILEMQIKKVVDLAIKKTFSVLSKRKQSYKKKNKIQKNFKK